ncbi:LysO family transporter [Chakrabartyella piscis]|uniref:LysO family transporter n=1 Tax=Chakrabartyella piscis TaxID=2918914 RepID=UPI00295866F6|nr:LysO family transporter [Chakrabartyella piscis]
MPSYLYNVTESEEYMGSIFAVLLIGFALGFFGIIKGRGVKINGKLQTVWLMLLIFSMGVSIGQDKEVIGNLPILGGKALVFAVATVLGSIVLVYVLSKLVLEKKEEK